LNKHLFAKHIHFGSGLCENVANAMILCDLAGGYASTEIARHILAYNMKRVSGFWALAD
jgi:hypothetical protein